MICNVDNCRYEAISDIEEFPVCGLHDCEHVRAIIEDLKKPGHFWSDERPIVVPTGALTVEDFTPIPGDGVELEECSRLAAINFERHTIVLPRFDLTKEWMK